MGRLYASAMCNGIGTITIGGQASRASLIRLPSMICGLGLPNKDDRRSKGSETLSLFGARATPQPRNQAKAKPWREALVAA
jgi:hypothetical protein